MCPLQSKDPNLENEAECLAYCAAFAWCKAASYQGEACYLWDTHQECNEDTSVTDMEEIADPVYLKSFSCNGDY